MTKNFKRKWINALRSGKYKQGREMLRSSDNKFCCLGVLCDIVGRGKWKPSDTVSPYIFKYGNQTHWVAAPDNWFRYGEQGTLMEMNDKGLSFDKIANYIENNIDSVKIRIR